MDKFPLFYNINVYEIILVYVILIFFEASAHTEIFFYL
jgi:hypothetical protein